MSLHTIKNKFKVGDELFVCDGGEYHGKVAIITKVDVTWSSPRYDGFIKLDKEKFRFEKEENFCLIKHGTCELCGSPEGIVKPPYPEKEFGDVYVLAVRKFPYAVACICQNCQKLFDLREEKMRQRNKARSEFRDAEYARRKKNGLCEKCGGEVSTSGPCLVYEGTYETTHRCANCGKEDRYT